MPFNNAYRDAAWLLKVIHNKALFWPHVLLYLPTSIPSVSLLDTKYRSGTVTEGAAIRDEDHCPVRLKIFDKRFTLIDPRLKISVYDLRFPMKMKI